MSREARRRIAATGPFACPLAVLGQGASASGLFLADDQPHVLRPAVKEVAREFGDPGPSRISPPGSTAGVQAEAWTFSTCSWMAAVITMPAEQENHRPRRASQATSSCVRSAESVRISVWRPAGTSCSWVRASPAAVMWWFAVFNPVFPGRSRAATGSLVLPGPCAEPTRGDDRRSSSRSGRRPACPSESGRGLRPGRQSPSRPCRGVPVRPRARRAHRLRPSQRGSWTGPSHRRRPGRRSGGRPSGRSSA